MNYRPDGRSRRRGDRIECNLLRCICRLLADCVAKVFCPSECVRLIQDQASMRNVDSRIHSLRFDCCVFLFYSFSAVTFATKSARRVTSLWCRMTDAIGAKRTCRERRERVDLARMTHFCRAPLEIFATQWP